MGKPYLTAALSPSLNDFTTESAFWLFLTKGGIDVAGVGVKYQNIQTEDLSRFWERTISRQYPPNSDLPTATVHCSDAIRGVGGRMVYMGDLYLKDGKRGDRTTLESFVRLLHVLSGTKWKFDWVYAFIRQRDAELGFGVRYGFARLIPGPQIWNTEHPGRGSSEYLMLKSADEHRHMMNHFARSLEGP
jgi:hypothetical protein